jgi:hypothetical protein
LTPKVIELRKMTEKEYAKYMEARFENYAQVRARAFKSTVKEEMAVANERAFHVHRD